MDQLLAPRGYDVLDRTLVWSMKLPSDPMIDNPALHTISLATWFPIYCQFSDRYIELQHRHRELLERITFPLVYAALYQQGTPVACGLGVLEHEAFGLFDIVTAPEQRRKGYGTQLVTGMLDWGRQHGARYAYLQVLGTNRIAQQMYAKLGFQERYHYWHRRQTQ